MPAPHSVDTAHLADEAIFKEIEVCLTRISGLQDRLEQAARTITDQGARDGLIDALRAAKKDLADTHTRLMQQTYYAPADTSLF